MSGAILPGDQVAGNLTLRPDVCVVGSGPGGAMVASRLARAGLSVVVLEEGGYFTKDAFDMQESTAYPRLYQDRGNRATADLSISVLQGRAVGGGSVVNWTTSFRTPDHVVKHWQQKEGGAIGPKDLTPHFEEIESRLGINQVELDDVNANNRTLYDGCKKLGWQVDTIKRNVRGCLKSGYCGMGCPVGAKQSAALTYLPDAVAAGANLYANCRVQELEVKGDRVVAAIGVILDPLTQQPTGKLVRVEARATVVSGGALNSPALLLRSGLTQGPVGRFTWLHPVVAVSAAYRDRIEGFYGAPQSVASHQFAQRTEGAGFFMEAAPVHPMLSGIALGGFGARLRGNMRGLAHVGPKLDYPQDERHHETFRAGMKAMARLQLANGALEVDTLHTRSLRITKESDLAQIDSEPLGPNRCAVFTAHQMGGCRMGADPKRSVVDPHLRHHSVHNLWVIDGSVFPTSLGVNPMESIYGVSSWGAAQLLAALKSS